MSITAQDISDLIDLRDLLGRMSENAMNRGSGITYPDEIALLNRVIQTLEAL